jgi:hypothetical protein
VVATGGTPDWPGRILVFHATNGVQRAHEAVNLVIKVKRVGRSFRNVASYRRRLLLPCGVRWQTHQTARLRGRYPRLVA